MARDIRDDNILTKIPVINNISVKSLKNDIRRAIENRVVNLNHKRDISILNDSIKAVIKTYIAERIIPVDLDVNVTPGENNTAVMHFYYEGRELYIESVEDLVNFDPFDYRFFDKDKDGNEVIYESSPIMFTVNLNLE